MDRIFLEQAKFSSISESAPSSSGSSAPCHAAHVCGRMPSLIFSIGAHVCVLARGRGILKEEVTCDVVCHVAWDVGMRGQGVGTDVCLRSRVSW